MSIKNFTPCSDWFFVFEDPQGKVINYRLAGWAVTEGTEGKGDVVVGMVPVRGGGNENIMPGICHLVLVPSVIGTYKHESDIGK